MVCNQPGIWYMIQGIGKNTLIEGKYPKQGKGEQWQGARLARDAGKGKHALNYVILLKELPIKTRLNNLDISYTSIKWTGT